MIHRWIGRKIALNGDEETLEKLNIELSAQCPTFHPDYGNICSERPLIDYRRGIWISDMELYETDSVKLREPGLEITNKIRTKVRCTLRKSYRKFMKESDLKAIEKVLFRFCDENFDDGVGIDLSDDDIPELAEIFNYKHDSQNSVDDNRGDPVPMEKDFTIEEILDMPVMVDEIGAPKASADKEQNPNNSDIADNESHDNSNHGMFYVTGKDLDCIDIDDLY